MGSMGDKRKQDLEKADTPSITGRRDKTQSNTGLYVGRKWERMGLLGEKRRQDLGKADVPSNTGTHMGTMRDKGGAMGNETSGRQSHHPTQTLIYKYDLYIYIFR